MMKLPALALVAPDYRIVRSTETFRARCEAAEKMCESSPGLEQVLTGRADAATANFGELSVAIQAVTDATGRRQAMLTLPPVNPSPPPAPPLLALRDTADESPAIVWVKDLEGRYRYANPCYAETLGTSEERLHGNTDADLPEAETVDGPRLRHAEEGLEEPAQLEYTVPALDGRPALVAFRFALRDESGRRIATCGVAAPLDEAAVARDEAVRLMQLERWNRLDPIDVRAELLEQWRVAPATAPEAESVSRPTEVPAAPTPAPPSTSATAPAPVAPTLTDTAELLQTDLRMARRWASRAEQLQDQLQQAQARIQDVESDAQQAQAAAARALEEADHYRSELERVRLELERAHLSEALGRALAAEGERGEELERTLAGLRAGLTDFKTAFDGQAGTPARPS
jgi:PAS domain S-box-containing protein